MLNYNHVLLATNLSTQSHLIAQQAREIADQSQANLSMIHVLEHSPVTYGGEFTVPIDIDLEQSLQQHAESALEQLGTEFKVAKENQHIATGSVKLAVIDLANEIKADLIIVGTHGHHGIDLLLGSRANAILHLAKCDVWVIRLVD